MADIPGPHRTHVSRRNPGVSQVGSQYDADLMSPVRLSFALGIAVFLGAPAAAVAVDYPARDARYHSYAEMVSHIKAVEADHPDIVRTFSIGRSHQGRKLWAAEVSDNVGLDEGEPEVLFDGLHHAREHLSAEQAIDVLDLLSNKYGKRSKLGRRVTRLVDTRRTFIVFMLNPDGLVHDLKGKPYRDWRKNRQPTPGSSKVGTDLNRNWAYRYGCCGGSSRNPASDFYRGPAPWSTPEVRALRDFVNGRVVDGIQRIRTHVSFHTAGELVLWPYAYTKADAPKDMTYLDHRALKAMGRTMARMSRYRPRQSSDAFRTDGDMIDWMYGRHRIFSYTFELYPRGGTSRQRHYPPDELIKRETRRNRDALLYLIGQAGCPYKELGQRFKRAYCGPLFDDLEVNRGWTVDPRGTDTATGGTWVRGKPKKSTRQLRTRTSGRSVLVTGRKAGRDVDGGTTTIRSPRFRAPSSKAASVRLDYWVGLSAAAGPDDGLRIHLVDDDGTRVATLLAISGDGDGRAPRWKKLKAAIPVEQRGAWLAIELEAIDGGADAVVEAGIDQVRVRLD